MQWSRSCCCQAPLSQADRVILTEKSNGKAAVITMFRFQGELYVFGGSKGAYLGVALIMHVVEVPPIPVSFSSSWTTVTFCNTVIIITSAFRESFTYSEANVCIVTVGFMQANCAEQIGSFSNQFLSIPVLPFCAGRILDFPGGNVTQHQWYPPVLVTAIPTMSLKIATSSSLY